MKLKYVPPKIIQSAFSNFLWKTNNNKILITFDDGPNPETSEIILEILSQNNIKAIFFCVGNNIDKNSNLVERILLKGHSIGNHTYNHSILTKLNTENIKHEIELVNSMMLKNFGYGIEYFRPPHGKFPLKLSSILTRYNQKNVMWTLLPYDYKNNPNILKFAVKKYLRKNSIIVLHDSIKSRDIIRESISFIIEEAKKNGFEFGEPAECLR